MRFFFTQFWWKLFTFFSLATLVVGSLVAEARPVRPEDVYSELHTVAFGSCNFQRRSQKHWDVISRFRPDLWIWGGDNIYADHLSASMREGEYKLLRSNEHYRHFASKVPIVGTWDDHDFGSNNVGGDFSGKQASQKMMLDFFDEPADSQRRKQEGVYWSWVFGRPGRQVQVIVLDERYFREDPGMSSDILGVAQWEWLEREVLTSNSQLLLVMSSSQVLAPANGGDTWSQYPKAREALLRLLHASPAPVLILSGDRHFAEISAEPSGHQRGRPRIIDFTSSGLTHSSNDDGENPLRVGKRFNGKNFGLVRIDWSQPGQVGVKLEIHDANSGDLIEKLGFIADI